MTVTLDYTIKLQSGFAFLEMEVLHKAEDMARFLSAFARGEKLYASPLQEAAQREMQRLGFIDSNGTITKSGKALQETKMRAIKECGKYRIQYSAKDTIFGNRIFFVKREVAIEQERAGTLEDMQFSQSPHFVLDFHNKAIDRITLQKVAIEKDCSDNDSVRYQRFYDLDNIKRDREIINTTEHKNANPFLDTQIFEAKYRKVLGSNWDIENLHYKIDRVEIDSFLGKKIITDARQFMASFKRDNFTFKNVALYPKEKEDSLYLLLLCIVKDLSEGYLSIGEFLQKIQGYIAHKALRDFLHSDEMEEYKVGIESHLQEADKKEETFWHYFATKDLLPHINFTLPLQRQIILQHNEEKSYKEIVSDIKQKRDIESFLYIDSYFTNPYQYKRVELLIQGFEATRNCIITDEKNVVALKEKGINAKSFDSIMAQEKRPHDRYLILKLQSGFEVWSITQSDFLYFEMEAASITLETKGRALGGTMNNLGENIKTLPQALRDFIIKFLEA